MYSASKKHRYILAVICLLVITLSVLVFVCPPALFPDPSWGFQVMRCMQHGGSFNMAITPDPSNIAKNISAFLTWWSPGQYLMPYSFIKLFNFNQGQGASATIMFCDMLGIFGFYLFFKKIGFSPMVAALSIAFIACQQFFFIPYVFYNGGETLLFGFLGWFLYGCFSFENISWKPVLFVLVSGWIGFFCKSAFLWMYASGVLCLWINLSKSQKNLSHWVKNSVLIGIPALVSLLSIYKLFLSKGNNPASASAGLHFTLEAIGFPLASPLLSGFSIDDLFHGLIYHQDAPVVTTAQTTFILVVLAITSIALFVTIVGLIRKPQYQLAITAFYTVSCLFFFSAFLRQLDISYEGRHFRIVGLLFIPGAIHLFIGLKNIFKAVFIAFWAFIAFTSIRYFTANYKYNIKESVHGPSGISQLFVDQPTMNYLQQLDRQHHNDAVFAFTSADLGLDIMNNRMITIDAPEDESPNSYVNDNEHQGNAGPLFILLPAYYVINGNVKLVEQAFAGYKHFEIKQVSKNYIVVHGM